MATLELTKKDIIDFAARMVGYPDEEQRSELMIKDLESAFLSGYRRFLYQTVFNGESYDWSFMYKDFTISFTDQYKYDMPEDFESFDFAFAYSDANLRNRAIKQVSENDLRRYRANNIPKLKDFPMYYSIAMENTNADTYNKVVSFFPTPTENNGTGKAVNCRYRVLVSEDNEQLLGGIVHHETIKYAVLAELQMQLEEIVGDHEAKYQNFLATSILRDRNVVRPRYLGRNSDPNFPSSRRNTQYRGDMKIEHSRNVT